MVREALKQRLVSQPPHDTYHADGDTALTRKYERILRLHDKAKLRCQSVVRDVVAIIQRNLGTSFFQYDASLVRDGCFFAAFLLAGETGSSEDVEACLQALNEMRWVFSKSEERMHTVRMVWQSRMQQTRSLGRTHSSSPMRDSHPNLPGQDMPYQRRYPSRAVTIPPLTIPDSSMLRTSSAPNTACTQDHGWSSSISTGSSQTNSQTRSNSLRGSPMMNETPPYLDSPQVTAVPDPSTSKNSLINPPSVLLSSTVPSAFDRPMDTDGGYYYHHYGHNVSGSSSQSGSHPGPSNVSGSLSLPSYHPSYLDHHSMGYSNSSISHTSGPLLPASSSADNDECVFATDSYYQ